MEEGHTSQHSTHPRSSFDDSQANDASAKHENTAASAPTTQSSDASKGAPITPQDGLSASDSTKHQNTPVADTSSKDEEPPSRFKHFDFDSLTNEELSDIMAGLSGGRRPKRKNALLAALIVVLLAFVIPQVYNTFFALPQDTLTTNQFISAVKNERVKNVVYKTDDSSVSGKYIADGASSHKDAATSDAKASDASAQNLDNQNQGNQNAEGTSSTQKTGERRYKSYYIGHDSLQALMSAHPNIPFSIDTASSSWIESLLTSIIPTVLMVGVMLFFINQIMSQNGKAMSFGNAKARVGAKSKPKVRFKDVAGIDEAVEELKEVRDFLREPARYRKLGAKIPRGVLLVGSPGTGKTLLAKAVAGEAGVPFFSISGSDFVEMFVGVGASRVRDLFKQAKQAAPSIIFIDEIDAVGRQRGAGVGGGHDEREQTLNQLLVEMDGFQEQDSVILIAATNRPDILDPALLRPGRFDRRVEVGAPDVAGRLQILQVHAANKPLASSVSLEHVSKLTPGLTGADLANLLNEAALLCARHHGTEITMNEIEEALERVIAGPEKKGRILTEKERRTIAYHEGGHALVGHVLNHADPVHKITIIPRGSALGYTLQIPEQDKVLDTKSAMLDQLAVMLGGRTSEELFCGDITTGASNDLEKATKLARNMVMRYGMSDDLGAQVYGEANHEVFLGRDYANHSNYSPETSKRIDDEVERLMREAHRRAREVLEPRKDHMETIARVLLERETVDGDAARALLDNEWDEYAEQHLSDEGEKSE